MEGNSLSALEAVQEARTQVADAEKTLRVKAKDAVREGLDAAFADGTVKAVLFAQKGSEYNDEGMYPGVFGPRVLDTDGEINIEELAHDYDGNTPVYDMLYGYGKPEPVDSRLSSLKTALDSIGEDVLSDLFGDECIVLVTKGANGYDFESEYAGV
jgi:hypothetical protein